MPYEIASTIYEDFQLSRQSVTVEIVDGSLRGKPKICPCGSPGVINKNKSNGYTAYERYCKVCRSNWRSHGLRPDDIVGMLVKQGFKCLAPSCTKEVTSRSPIDHRHGCSADHLPGRVSCPECQRGILCQGCNTFEGQVRKFFLMSETDQEWWKSYAV